MMHSRTFLLAAVGLIVVVGGGCRDSLETRKQRFLLQSNAMIRDRQDEKAEYYLREALKVDSCFADAWNNLGTLYFSRREYDKALEHYDNAIRCRSDYVDAYLNRANTAYELKLFYKMLADADKIIALRPDTVTGHFVRGLALTRLRDFNGAVRSFAQALRRDRNNADILVNLGTVYYYRRSYDSARHFLDKARHANPKEPNVYNSLAMIYIETDQLDSASAMLDQALALRPDDPYFINNRGYVRLLRGDLEAARTDIDNSIAADPDNGWAYRNKGYYQLLKGDNAEAIRLLEKARQMDDFIERVDQYLGEAYLAANDRARACTHLQAAQNKGGQVPELIRKACR